MAEPAKEKFHRTAVKKRRLEIEQRLAAFSLARGPRRLLRSPSAPDVEDSHCSRLQAALISLGPVFSAFGLYLSSRIDLFPANYCAGLSTIPDRALPTPVAYVRKLISTEIGRSPEDAYLMFEEEPFESQLMFQSHRALVGEGKLATVTIVHPEFEEHLSCDLEVLPILMGAFAGREWEDLQIDNAIADFRTTVEQQADFARGIATFDALDDRSEDLKTLRVPVVYKSLSSSRVLTIERMTGIRLDDVVPFLHLWTVGKNTAKTALGNLGLDSGEVARSLCFVWLSQALGLGSFFVEPRPDRIVVLPDNTIAFTGGFFTNLPADAKTNLLNYLIAAGSQDSNKACSCLLEEMEQEIGNASEEKLLQGFQQVVPFRDNPRVNDSGNDSLADYLVVHSRLAGHYGYRAKPHLIRFNRGLFLIAAIARQLAPERDSLTEALDDLRLMTMFTQFQQFVNLRHATGNFDKYAEMMMGLPQKVDEVLALAAEGSARMKLQVTDTSFNRRENSKALVVGVLFILAAVALLSRYAAGSTLGVLADRSSVILFLLLAALLLRIARLC